MNSTISLCSRYLYWLGKIQMIAFEEFFCVIIDNDEKRSTVFESGDVEPGSLRGGLAGEFLVNNSIKFFNFVNQYLCRIFFQWEIFKR